MEPKLPPATNYYPVPRSTAEVELTRDDENMLGAKVRCSDCERRVFDLFADFEYTGRDYNCGPLWESRIRVERKCPGCKTRNRTYVTAALGEPLGESGPWKCDHCGAYLGKIDAPRGRIIVPCRCKKSHVRVTALDAMSVVDERNRAVVASTSVDDLEDLPF